MAVEPEIRISGDMVVVRKGNQILTRAKLDQVLASLGNVLPNDQAFCVLPPGARIATSRGGALAIAVELPPHTRRVRWLSDKSKVPYGKKAVYDDYFVSFPYVILLLVFRNGSLTGEQQLYYRNESMDRGDDLLLPNLYNVANGYGQKCWVCLANMHDVSELTWEERISAVVTHVFSATFNRSSERHEGNSYWTSHDPVDPKVASMKDWETATRADRRMALKIDWKPAGISAGEELERMLDRVVKRRSLKNATEFAGLVTGAAGPAKGSRRRPV